MTHESVPRSFPNWNELYVRAMNETNPATLPSAINKASDAILGKIESVGATDDQLPLLNEALNGLRILRREYERSLQEYGELRNRKVR
jgi:hypothetical protein